MPVDVLLFILWHTTLLLMLLLKVDVIAAMVVSDLNCGDQSDARDELIQRTFGLQPLWDDTAARAPPAGTQSGWMAANLFGC